MDPGRGAGTEGDRINNDLPRMLHPQTKGYPARSTAPGARGLSSLKRAASTHDCVPCGAKNGHLLAETQYAKDMTAALGIGGAETRCHCPCAAESWLTAGLLAINTQPRRLCLPEQQRSPGSIVRDQKSSIQSRRTRPAISISFYRIQDDKETVLSWQDTRCAHNPPAALQQHCRVVRLLLPSQRRGRTLGISTMQPSTRHYLHVLCDESHKSVWRSWDGRIRR
jgi:hypothetical protein